MTTPQPQLTRAEVEHYANLYEYKAPISQLHVIRLLALEALALMDERDSLQRVLDSISESFPAGEFLDKDQTAVLVAERDQLQHRFDGLTVLANTRIKGLIDGTDPASPIQRLEAERDACHKALEQIQAVFYQAERSDHDAAYTMKKLAQAALLAASTKIGA